MDVNDSPKEIIVSDEEKKKSMKNIKSQNRKKKIKE